jgi:hypothetical protein
MSHSASSTYVIVPRRPGRHPAIRAALALAWAASLAAAWMAATWYVAPRLPGMGAALESARSELQASRDALAALRQRQATLERSDQISRVANNRVQQELAARDEQIAGLKADLAFYERLAGATRKPKGLSVHSAEFAAGAGGTWQYQLMLTQNLNRGAVSTGVLRFAIEGVKDGELVSLDWDRLHQRDSAPPQTYSFRYFQQLEGSVILPDGFVPQQVRVSLRGKDTSLDQAVAWAQPARLPSSETGES